MATAQPTAIDPKLNPLKPEDQQKLIDAKNGLNDVVKVIEAAEECGTDCQQFRQLVEMLGARIQAMEQTYFNKHSV